MSDIHASHASPHSSHGLTSYRSPQNPLGLPCPTSTNDAEVVEHTTKTGQGHITRQEVSKSYEKIESHELVTFKPDDPENPKNWSKAYKWYYTIVVALTCFIAVFNSAVITADISGPSREFHVSAEIILLTVTLFVLGFGVGPMVFAPLSEMIGRRVVYSTTLGLAIVFIIPCAVADNIGTLLVCRFIDGIAFSAPMTLVGGTLADLWRNEERGVPMAVFSATPFLGPFLGPIIGGFPADAKGWRWLYWIQLIFSGAAWIAMSFTVPETHTPIILSRRAAKMRKETGDTKWVTGRDLNPQPLGQRLRIYLFRPFQILFREPIVFFVSVYMTILYGLLYMYFIAYPIIYEEGKGYNAGTTGLMFIPLLIGIPLSALISLLVNKHYLNVVAKHNGHPPAEARLLPMLIACWLMPIGLFIFAWTSMPHISYWGPMMGGFPVGFGIIIIYSSANNYIVDTYQHQAASAFAAQTFLRCFWAAGVVLFTRQMYHKLGYQWPGSVLAFISLACCAIPYVFYFYGAKIRAHSHYAYHSDEETVPAMPVAKDKEVQP